MESTNTTNSTPTTLAEAKETMDILSEISSLLNTGLDRETLSLCVSLTENGVNPEALAAVIRELRREAASLVRSKGTSNNNQ